MDFHANRRAFPAGDAGQLERLACYVTRPPLAVDSIHRANHGMLEVTTPPDPRTGLRPRFALDPAVVGKAVLINNSPFTIIGVTPAEFFGVQPGEPIDVSFPLTTYPQVVPGMAMAGTRTDILTAPFLFWLSIMGRLQPGVTKEKALANLQSAFRQAMHEAACRTGGYAVRFS